MKWFDDVKGYGYIQSNSGEEVFVHFSNIKQKEGFKTLMAGSLVQFEMLSGEFGPKAIDVKKISTEQSSNNKMRE